MKKDISMTLDSASIANAIKEVQDFKEELQNRMAELAEHLVEEGREIAQIILIEMDANFTGDLIENGILGFYDREQHCGAIYTDHWYAMFVEFGTGIIGAAHEHPLHGEVGWEHDTNGHGSKGWWYPAPWGWWTPKMGPHAGQRMAWTNGMPARPFMYNTLRELERMAEREGITFFQNM